VCVCFSFCIKLPEASENMNLFSRSRRVLCSPFSTADVKKVIKHVECGCAPAKGIRAPLGSALLAAQYSQSVVVA